MSQLVDRQPSVDYPARNSWEYHRNQEWCPVTWWPSTKAKLGSRTVNTVFVLMERRRPNTSTKTVIPWGSESLDRGARRTSRGMHTTHRAFPKWWTKEWRLRHMLGSVKHKRYPPRSHGGRLAAIANSAESPAIVSPCEKKTHLCCLERWNFFQQLEVCNAKHYTENSSDRHGRRPIHPICGVAPTLKEPVPGSYPRGAR